jgi:hypothetical protein
MAKWARQFVGALLGCCLLAAAPGCVFSRAETSSASQRFGSLEDHRLRSTASEDAAERDTNENIAARSPDGGKPELLPWRSRIRDRILNGRLAHDRKEPAKQQQVEAVAALPGKPLPPSAERPQNEGPASSAVGDEVRVPANAPSRLNSPDFVAY